MLQDFDVLIFVMSGNRLQMTDQTSLHGKKKTPCRRITGFQVVTLSTFCCVAIIVLSNTSVFTLVSTHSDSDILILTIFPVFS